MKRKSILKCFLILLIIPILFLLVSYLQARGIAEKHMLMIGVHDEASFQEAKKTLYNISSDEEREQLWSKAHYPLRESLELKYKIVDIDCIEVKGLRHYIFNIKYELHNVNYENQHWSTLPMGAALCIKNGRVYDSYRID